MRDAPLTDWSALELRHSIANRELTCVEVVAAHLQRIDLLDGTYHSLISRRPTDEVLAEAAQLDRELDAGISRGWMHGLPHAIKDLVDARDLPTTLGFRDLNDAPIADEDEPFVERVREAGAVFVGKTNTPEFGLGSHTYNAVAPTTGNIADPTRSSGGSSGGAAVAVAAGLVPVADGSDFMGSVRNPPGWNGVLGVRPSPGVVQGRDSDATEPELAVDGPIARTVADLAALLGTMAGPSRRIGVQHPGRAQPRVGWLESICAPLAFETGVLEICRAAAARWSTEFHDVLLNPNDDFSGPESLWPAWLATRQDIVGSFLTTEFSDDEIGRMKPEAQWEIEGYRRLSDSDRLNARAVRAGLRRSAAELFDDLDLLVLPTAQVWPFPKEQHWPGRIGDVAMDTYHRWMEVTIFATLAELPALAVPAGTNDLGLHIGLQVIGRPREENALLRWGAWAEERNIFAVAPPSSAVPPAVDPTLTA